MKDNVTISVSSIHGTKHFSFAKRFRHTLRVFSYILLLGIVLTAITIYYLVNEAAFAKLKQQELETKSSTLIQEVTSLNELKLNLENDLAEREERMQLVSDRLGDLEGLLGMDTPDSDAVESRLDTAAITSSIRVAMLNQIPSGSPVKSGRTSSGFGQRIHPVTKIMKFHRGQDFAVNTGTPVYAPADGAVEVIRPSQTGSGNYLRIFHSHGFSSSYSHLSKFTVSKGEFVQKGDLIAYSGNTGLSSGPHLHYEVRFLGKALDPKPFVNWDIDNFDTIFASIRGIGWESLVGQIEIRVSHQLRLSSQKVALSTGTLE